MSEADFEVRAQSADPIKGTENYRLKCPFCSAETSFSFGGLVIEYTTRCRHYYSASLLIALNKKLLVQFREPKPQPAGRSLVA